MSKIILPQRPQRTQRLGVLRVLCDLCGKKGVAVAVSVQFCSSNPPHLRHTLFPMQWQFTTLRAQSRLTPAKYHW